MLLGVIFISRIDRSSLMPGFQTWDKGLYSGQRRGQHLLTNLYFALESRDCVDVFGVSIGSKSSSSEYVKRVFNPK